jgi:hypothetical protein
MLLTLEEYLNEWDGSAKLPVGSVVVRDNEYTAWSKRGDFHPVRIGAYPLYSYCVEHGQALIYSTDDDGNKKKATVFALENPLTKPNY